MKRSFGYILLALVIPMLSTGCVGRIVGEGAEKALGPKGDYWEEKPLAYSKADKVLTPYTHYVLGSVKNDYGRNVPPEFFGMFPVEFRKVLLKSKLPINPNGKTLLINVSVIHYEIADTTDNILGPLEQVVARVQLVDKSTNQVLGYGNVIGRTGKTVGLGTDKKAEGLAKGIVKWIKAYSPKPPEEEEEERESEGKHHSFF
jgi:hypothetical protein